MPPHFSQHALIRMHERRIQETEVILVIANPDELDPGPDGELIARKRIARRTVVVVYDHADDIQRVITVMLA